MARPEGRGEGLGLLITWDSTKGGCGFRFQDLTPTLANWLWSAVCHVPPALPRPLGFKRSGHWPLSPGSPFLGSRLAKAEGRQAAFSYRVQGGETGLGREQSYLLSKPL